MLDVDAVPTAWREAGEGGQIALFLHGLGGSRIAWEPQLRALSKIRRVVAWDCPGYGASQPVGEPTFAAYANAAADLIDRISPDEPVDLVGMSFGGMIAQVTAAKMGDRIRSLTLLCTSPKFGLDGTDPDEWRNARLSAIESGGSPAAAAPAIIASLIAPGHESVIPEAVAAMERVPDAGLMDAMRTIVHHDTRAILPTLTVPLLVLVGSLDEETPPAYGQAIVDLATSSPNARLVVIEGAGHVLNLEAVDAVNNAIAEHWMSAQ